jgi:hypothetical protein
MATCQFDPDPTSLPSDEKAADVTQSSFGVIGTGISELLSKTSFSSLTELEWYLEGPSCGGVAISRLSLQAFLANILTTGFTAQFRFAVNVDPVATSGGFSEFDCCRQ